MRALLGAIVQFGIPRVVVGEDVSFRGPVEWLEAHAVQVEVAGMATIRELLAHFTGEHPDVWSEDIGVHCD